MRTRFLTWAGAVFSGTLLILLFMRVDSAALIAGFQKVRPLWVLAAILCIVLAMAVRAHRWQVIAANFGKQRYWAFWDSVNIMYFGNAVYPGRVGELMRIWSIYRWANLPAGPAASTAVADRLADVFMIGLVAVWAIAHLSVGNVNSSSFWVVAVFILAPLSSFGVVRYSARVGLWVDKIATVLPERWARRLPRWYGQAQESAQVIFRPMVLLKIVLLSVFAIGLDYLTFYFGVLAMGWRLPFEAAVVTGIFVAVGMLVPSAPSSLGIYQVACVFALHQFGIPEAEAVAYSFVVQFSSLAVVLTQTAVTGLRRGTDFLAAKEQA